MLELNSINIGVIFRTLAIIVFALIVLPNQWAETKFKDALILPRYAILIGLVVCFLIMILAVAYNLYRQIDEPIYIEGAMNFLAMAASFKDFLIALILVFLYKRKYQE